MTFAPNSSLPLLASAEGAQPRRCAIYCRVSSDEGLAMEFNSIDAQREAGQAYVASQGAQRWACAAVYEDPGFSGATLRRPALTQLLHDIRKQRIDVVVVHRIDRLTRSLRDFSQIITLLESLNVHIVSVTQQFNTTSSMGRLTLNMMLSFAQFEREICSERIRDKIAASKKKGLWMGGYVPLGYRCVDRKLVIDPAEAEIVQGIFASYVTTGSAAQIAKALEDKGIRTKRHVTDKGRVMGDRVFTMKCIHRLINDPTYLGMVKHGDQIYPGQHVAIIDRETWDLAQAKSKVSRAPANHPTNALLSGLLFTRSGEPFYYRYTSKPTRRYGYYVSRSEARFGAGRAVARRIPAGWIEQKVAREICGRLISSDFITGLAALLKSTGHGVLAELSTPQLRAIFHDADALWQQLDAAEQRRLASALITRIDLGSVNPTSFQITWKADSLSPQPMEMSHAP